MTALALVLCGLLSAHAEADAPTGETRTPMAMTITLSDGQVLQGRALREEDGSVRLWLADGQVLLLPAAAVARMQPQVVSPGSAESRWGPDPNRSRYLYSPSGFAQGHGRGYLAQRAIVLSSAAVGVGDHLDLELGLVLPTLFTSSPVGAVGLKATTPVEEKVRLGAGAQAIVVPVDGVQAFGFLFGLVTVGEADSHLTVAGGVAAGFTQLEVPLAASTISFSHRLGPGSALISENWLMVFLPDPEYGRRDGPWGIPFFALPSGGIRLFGPSFAVDLALVPVVTGEREVPVLPLPWISLAWNWGRGAR